MIFLDNIDSENWLVGEKWGSRHKPVRPKLLAFWVFETSPEFLISVQTGYFSRFSGALLWVLIRSASQHMFLLRNKKNIFFFFFFLKKKCLIKSYDFSFWFAKMYILGISARCSHWVQSMFSWRNEKNINVLFDWKRWLIWGYSYDMAQGPFCGLLYHDQYFVFQITRADVEVQPYAFTTKSLFVGHTDYQYLRWQVNSASVQDHFYENHYTYSREL